MMMCHLECSTSLYVDDAVFYYDGHLQLENLYIIVMSICILIHTHVLNSTLKYINTIAAH